MTAERVARRVRVTGIVQGVGFRPFVYGLAEQYAISGQVGNTASGVSMHVEGLRQDLDAFCADLAAKRPPLALITAITAEDAPLAGHDRFSIQKSRGQSARSALISPDVTVCADCLRELNDPADRRFRYPFINCTNCGPRYTIIADIPYDRPMTSMRHFKMCARCQAEYDDPLDRRFHAQPNACPLCGPKVTLWDRQGTEMAAVDPISAAVEMIRQGQIVAIKGLGGFHLAVDATSDDAVANLRRRKRRRDKPLALMSQDLDRIRVFARMTPAEAELLESIQRPIVLLPKRRPNPISARVAPRCRYFGVMLPYTPLHHLLLEAGFSALVMTSGNPSEEPIAIDNTEALARLGSIADAFLVHDREILLRADDSIVIHSAGATRPLRRSRGYAPVPVFLDRPLPPVLACGGGLKSTVCLAKENRAFVSQHIGDLQNPAAYDFYCSTIDHLKHIFDIEPEIVAHDLHPDYLSTRYALAQTDRQRIGVQHHHAHIVACMAEHGLEDPVLGMAFDGTGYGTDGHIWGGEILIADAAGFVRADHLQNVSLPGGEAAIREPWRMGLSYLHAAWGEDCLHLDLPLLRDIAVAKLEVVKTMLVRGLNCPQTSSLGRLFDGVAALAGLRYDIAYEGQAAAELEAVADRLPPRGYDVQWETGGDSLWIAPAAIIRPVVQDLLERVPLSTVSARFHTTLIHLFTRLGVHVGRREGLDRVVLSGGVFQNTLLFEGLKRALEQEGFEVFGHSQVPANDGGISLGQALIAAAQKP